MGGPAGCLGVAAFNSVRGMGSDEGQSVRCGLSKRIAVVYTSRRCLPNLLWRPMKDMNEAKRLELIVEAVRYCQRARTLGMPPSCYTKALREPIYFLWTRRAGGRKDRLARYRSRGSVGLKYGDGELVFDHAVPFNYLQSELLQLEEVTPERVRAVLLKNDICVLITKSENDRLNANGLQSKMLSDWDHADPLARYKVAGIELVEGAPEHQNLPA